MEIHTLKLSSREETGKGPARRRRVAGTIPGVLYGGDQDPVAVVANSKQFETIIHGQGGEHAILELEFEDNPSLNTHAMLKGVQHHPTKEVATHADFMRIDLDQRIRTVVPIKLTGRCKGLAEGGLQDQHIHRLPIECVARNVPDCIEADITEVGIGHSYYVREITPPADVTILVDGASPIIAINAPRVGKTKGAAAATEEAGAPEAEEA